MLDTSSHCTQFGLQLSDTFNHCQYCPGLCPSSSLICCYGLWSQTPQQFQCYSQVCRWYIPDYPCFQSFYLSLKSRILKLGPIETIWNFTGKNLVKLYSSDPSQTGTDIPRLPPPAVQGFARVQHITAFGVTLSYNFSMAKHIDTVMSIWCQAQNTF